MRGPRLLSDYLDGLDDGGRSEFAKAVGVGRVTVWRWESGLRVPGVGDALAIERETKGAVPVKAWVKEQPKSRRAGRARLAPEPA